MHKEILSLAWLGSRMLFVHVRGGQTVSLWECEGSIDEYEGGSLDVGARLRDAVRHTGYRGKNVVMLLDHAKMSLQLLSTPPAKGRDLELYIERQIGQLKVHDEDVAWSWLHTMPIKSSKGLVLCLFPMQTLQRLYDDCRAAALHLLMILPPAAALADEFSALPVEPEDITLLAVDTGQGNTLLIGRKNEPIYIARSLRCSWQENLDRVASQINRSTVFLRQQFGTDISRIWLMGTDASGIVDLLQEETGMPVDHSPALPLNYWAEKAASIHPDAEVNLVSRELRSAPQRRRRQFIVTCGLAFLAIFSLGSYVWTEMRIRSGHRLVERMTPAAEEAGEKKADLEARLAELDIKEKVVHFVKNERLPSVPGWFVAYLANTLPPELSLTNVQVRRQDTLVKGHPASTPAQWWVKIEGFAPESAVAASGPEFVKSALTKFMNDLSDGPFHLAITDKTNRFIPRSSPIAWSVSTSSAATSGPNQFFVEGTIKAKEAK